MASACPCLPALLLLLLLLLQLSLAPRLAGAGCPSHYHATASSGAADTNLQSAVGPARRWLQSTPGTTTAAYLENVKQLDLAAVKADLAQLLTSAQEAWPADFGYYGGLFVRLAWHCSGSYRTSDGRGGCDGAHIRFPPEADWLDNTNLDKARMLLEPIKAKYGDNLSWGDLIILAGNTAIEQSGGPQLGLCLGRIDSTDGNDSLALGPTKEQEQVAPCKLNGNCSVPLGPTTIGLIYVDPGGPLGVPDPNGSAPQIRDTFGRMGMNDSETVALIGGGHALGKAHGACPAGPGKCGTGELKGKGKNTVTSGFEGSWTVTPTKWTNDYFNNLLSFTWVAHEGPGGNTQWQPQPSGNIFMLTSDVALLHDPAYQTLVAHYGANLTALNSDFAAAWYKLTTRDMGSYERCADVNGTLPPPQDWQCPLPAANATAPDYNAVAEDIAAVLNLGTSPTQSAQAVTGVASPDSSSSGTATYAALFATLAWQSASTYRDTDHQGGTNGARIRFSPIADFPGNQGLDKILQVLQPIKDKYPGLSYADLIVLAGYVALNSSIPLNFTGGRTDANGSCVVDEHLAPRVYQSLVVTIKDDAQVKGLSLPEYVALLATPRSPSHQRSLGYSGSWSPVVQPLSNAFFQTLLEEKWVNSTSISGVRELKAQGKAVYVTPTDAALTQDPELLATVQQFAQSNTAFLETYASGWDKMMNAGLYSAAATSPPAPFPTSAPRECSSLRADPDELLLDSACNSACAGQEVGQGRQTCSG